jgi:cbb3-type cytochrome oxidase maturation protein
MTVIVVMVVASLIVALGFLAAFVWAVKSGQFDDTTTPSMRILFESRQGENKDVDKNQSPE